MTATSASPGASSGVGTCSTCSERRGSLSRVAIPENISTSSLCTVAARYVSGTAISAYVSMLRSPERMASRIWSMRSCSFGGGGRARCGGGDTCPANLVLPPPGGRRRYDGPHGVIRLTGAGTARRRAAYSSVVSLTRLPRRRWCSARAGRLTYGALAWWSLEYRIRRAEVPLYSETVAFSAPGARELVPTGHTDAVVPGTRVLAARPLSTMLVEDEQAWLETCAPWVRTALARW